MWFFKAKQPKIYYPPETSGAEEGGSNPVGLLSQALRAVYSESPDWMNKPREGQLAVDVYQTEDEVVIKTVVAGVKMEDLEITVANDMVTIRGRREDPDAVPAENYVYQECYWGWFSRTVVVPCEVLENRARAALNDGVLKIVLPKRKAGEEIDGLKAS